MTEERYRIVVSDDAEKQLRKLDKPVQKRVMLAIGRLEEDPRPAGAKKLKARENRWRIRVGDRRVVYEIEDDRLVVLVIAIGHRSDVYRAKR
ncbi:type II toxin-antitoxin system RelE family toxin [Glycomyces xiaoerkulensis]|uniref:type II toxin-antitoxin system RelE family toxin n=1 Tax=Glycomyces xiaoerkulensis TaxID=2038139 RepID=UPI000C25BFE7|nr:type II toxin-antitoxin system RelE/ParE family toxin [Glycomyces xiaoerkulensis]